ncbi:Predicted reductase RutE in novel pyrimidine catabolism pathway [invertebrate metagenome]|uniref:Predicted reductase RutE in novel pyrimidine catabolism pathway n=1 Tax=invertebrate metagenome TaxID=1711999 RepID=A0A484H602_9ZZZZ
MPYTLDDNALDLLFRTARTHNHWRNIPIPDDVLHALHALMCLGPTSANCQPARLLFVKSPEAKARLRPALIEGNIEKTMTAPVTAIIGYDLTFHERLPYTFPQADAQSWFAGNDSLIRETAFRNGTLQGAYLIIAARALGLDCGPMSGFDNAAVDQAFFPNSTSRSNFLCNLGYGDPSGLYPRNPRLSFEEQCQIL